MKKLILFSAFISLFLASCNNSQDTDTVSQSTYTGVFAGKYTDQSSTVNTPSQDCVVTVTENANGSLNLEMVIGSTTSNLTAAVTSDNKLNFAEQSVFGTMLQGNGENVDSGKGLNLLFSKPGASATVTSAFTGRKQ